MFASVSARDARQKFSEVLNEAVYGRKKIFITRFGKPEAVILGLKNFNPKDWVTENEWLKGFEVFDKIRAKGKDLTEEEAERLVRQAVDSLRSKRV